jgi:hypothetical protein
MKKILVIVPLALLIVYWVAKSGGVDFTLTNVGAEALRGVVVEVTGRSYTLGDLSPGSSETVKLNAASDSHIELRFSNGRHLTIDCYFGATSGGSIRAKVTSQAVVAVEDEIS